MTTTIALAGKGGVGKTTIAALIVKYLIDRRQGAVLAIDADPSSNLNMALGLDLHWTVGDIREDLLKQVKDSLLAGGAAMGTVGGGMSKQAYLDLEIRSSISEGERFDLIAMGRSEGPGCYCAVNHNLRQVIDAISKNYRWVVIDNEAGMEHLSRRTTRAVQHLLVISDPTLRGLTAAARIAGFRDEIDIDIEQVHLIINRLSGELPPQLAKQVDAMNLPLLGTIPADEAIGDLDLEGDPIVTLGENSPSYQAVAGIFDRILDR